MNVYLTRWGLCSRDYPFTPVSRYLDAHCWLEAAASDAREAAREHIEKRGMNYYDFEFREPGWSDILERSESESGSIVWVLAVHNYRWDSERPYMIWYIEQLELKGSPLEALADCAE